MEIRYPSSKIKNPLEILRKAGYVAFTDPISKEHSFTFRLSNGFYPRFHLYLNEKGTDLVFSLHLDQKKPSYSGSHKHSGEYDGATVEKEMKRINGWIHASFTEDSQETTKESKTTKRKGLFGKIFG